MSEEIRVESGVEVNVSPELLQVAKEVKDKEVPVEKKEPVDFTLRIVKPHTVISAPVTEEDVPRLIEDAKVMYNLCYTVVGRYPGAYAVAHAQIDDKKPLRFFVTSMQEIIINPVITRHTKTPVDSKEGCITFSDKDQKIMPRYHKIEVDMQTLTADGKLSEVQHVCLSGRDAFMFQHEIDHMNALYIY